MQTASDNGRGGELRHIAISISFLAVATLAVWFLQDVLGMEGDALFVALLTLPIILYLVLSGRVGEFSTGGLSVKLREASSEPAIKVAQYVKADYGPRSDPTTKIRKMDPNRPHLVTLTHGGGPYDREKTLARLRLLAANSAVPLMIVLDARERVIAYMTYHSALDLLQNTARGEQFIATVNAGDPAAFDNRGGFSAVKTDTFPHTMTNAEALSKMDATGLDALIVVDQGGRFSGIVERDRVLTRMMLALVS